MNAISKIKRVEVHNSPNRQNSLDLLRAICAVFVVFQHFCEESAHNAFGFSLEASFPAHILLRVLYAIARTAVPVFFILSGYFSIDKQNQKVGKIANLYVMVISYSLIIPALSIFEGIRFGNTILSFKTILYHCLAQNYYLYLFAGTYILSPFINKVVNSLKRAEYKRLIVYSFLMFNVWSTIINTMNGIREESFVGTYFTSMTGTSMGFNLLNFMNLYLVGGYIKHYYIVDFKRDRLFASLIVLISAVVTGLSKVYFPALSRALWYYDSVFIVIPAIAIVILFLSFHVKNNWLVTTMALHTFGTFIIHGTVSNLLPCRPRRHK